MDGVLHADDAKLAQGALNQVVGGDGGAVASNLSRKNWEFYPGGLEFSYLPRIHK